MKKRIGKSLRRKTICIITADKAESHPVAKYVQNAKKRRVEGFKIWRGTIAGQSVLLITRAMGAEKAQRALEVCNKLVRPVLFIKFGAAGAVDKELSLSEVVAPELLLKLDTPNICMLQDDNPSQNPVIAQTKIATPLIETLRRLPLRIVHSSAETNSFICSSQIRNWLAERVNVASVDMESYTVVSQAKALGIPAVSIQVITDYVDERAKEEFRTTLQAGALERAISILIQFINRLNESILTSLKL